MLGLISYCVPLLICATDKREFVAGEYSLYVTVRAQCVQRSSNGPLLTSWAATSLLSILLLLLLMARE
jgi:hypothetical protein